MKLLLILDLYTFASQFIPNASNFQLNPPTPLGMVTSTKIRHAVHTPLMYIHVTGYKANINIRSSYSHSSSLQTKGTHQPPISQHTTNTLMVTYKVSILEDIRKKSEFVVYE